MAHKSRGVTLIEVIVVIMICMVLMALIFPAILHSRENARRHQRQGELLDMKLPSVVAVDKTNFAKEVLNYTDKPILLMCHSSHLGYRQFLVLEAVCDLEAPLVKTVVVDTRQLPLVDTILIDATRSRERFDAYIWIISQKKVIGLNLANRTPEEIIRDIEQLIKANSTPPKVA